MARNKSRTVGFNNEGIDKLPQDKPVLYKIKTQGNNTNYAGIAQRGRIQDRLKEHLAGGPDPIPGAKVQIQQMPSISDARKKEAGVIARSRPKYNRTKK